MLALDLFLHRNAKEIPLKKALRWSFFWILLSLIFCLCLYFNEGYTSALNFLAGYTLEKSLSVDNLFVFLLIFRHFNTPKESYHKVLFWGIVGALVMRLICIFAGIALIQRFEIMFPIFGIFLLYASYKLIKQSEQKVDVGHNLLLNLCQRFLPINSSYAQNAFFIKMAGKWMATPLLLVLIAIESTDLVFALDSIPAILGITQDPFIVYTSNVFAILGLRSLFFALIHILQTIKQLHYGLGLILAFIGIEMVLHEFIVVPTFITLCIIILTLTVTVIASLKMNKS